ncbi:CH082 protein, partial [Sterrhoptilus dennistouni]|nr:CH082 protein [Sterrhoptilus dennistouni]
SWPLPGGAGRSRLSRQGGGPAVSGVAGGLSRPGPGIREYFYYVDDHGQLFLDDAKVKNFITCFKDIKFLSFFFKHLERNLSGRYHERFPFLSRCGRERNFLRCSDLPVVFTQILPGKPGGNFLLSYCGGGSELTVPFQPGMLTVFPANGRVYHPAPVKSGGVGLVSSALAAEFSSGFRFEDGQENPPTHFWWDGKSYRLPMELLVVLRAEKSG